MPAECLGHILSGHFNKCLEYYNFSACVCGIYWGSLQLHSIIWQKRGFTNFSEFHKRLKDLPMSNKTSVYEMCCLAEGCFEHPLFLFISVQHQNAIVKSAIKTIHCVIVAKLVVRHHFWFSVAFSGSISSWQC